MNQPDEPGENSVVQFFEDGQYEYVRRNVSDLTAVLVAKHYCTCVGAKLGTTVRVMIEAGDGDCVFEWKREDGVVWPDQFKGMYKKGVN